MIGVVDVECQAANPNMPLYPMRAFVGSPSSLRLRNVPKRIGDWCIRSVEFTAVYPDGTIKTANCVLTGGVWVGTIEGTSTSGTSKNGYTIFASGTDENGEPVTGYILGKGDITILEADRTLSPDPARYTVKLLSAEATQPREGDMYPTEGGYVIWQNGQANQLGTPFEEITAYVDSAISGKADISAVESYISGKADLSALESYISGKADLSALELKQDQLSDDQLYVIDREVYYLYTQILTPTGQFRFLSPPTLDKSVLIEQGILSQDGNTWLYTPQRVILGSTVNTIGTNTFKDAVILEYFQASNAGSIQSNAFNGCTRLNTVTIPSIMNLGSYAFRYCSSLKNLTLPKSLLTVGRYAFTDNSLDYVFFEGKTLAQVKAMANYDRWGLAEDKIYTAAFENQLPTKTSELSNDSGFITSADIVTKRDINDLNIYVDPIADMTTTKFTVVVSYAFDPSTPLFTAELTHSGGEEIRWSWSPSGSNQSISIDYYSNDGSYHLSYINIQDGSGTEHSGQITLPIAAPYWTGEAQDDQFHFSVTSQITTIATEEEVPTKTSDLTNDSGFITSNPWTCGWRITFNGTSTDNSLSARLNGRLIAYTDNRKICRFDCVLDRSNISELRDFLGMDFQAFITINDLSNLVDGYTKDIIGPTLTYTDAWGYYKNEVPTQTEFDFLSVTFNIQE